VDPYDEPLEEPLYLDGIAIRRWSDLSRVPRPRQVVPPDRLTPRQDPVFDVDSTPS
jgi:hypothetical protein